VAGKGRLEDDGHWVRWFGRRIGEVLDINGKVIGIGQVCMLLSQLSSRSSVCIVPDILAVLGAFYDCFISSFSVTNNKML
jgi:hypothetical protein